MGPRVSFQPRRSRHGERGQVLVIAVGAMVAIIALVALVLEGGNAYAQQRQTQNGADAAANAGAAVLALRFADGSLGDADVDTAVTNSATANDLDNHQGYYTNVRGEYLDTAGSIVAKGSAALVGGGVIPSGAQGVAVDGSRLFDAFFGRVIGFTQFTSSADATAVAGALIGGAFLPVVFPINISDCEINGSLGAQETDGDWKLASPPATPGGTPVGIEYIVPLCKTGGGSFQILDFDSSLKCDEEIEQKIQVTLTLPQYVDSDNGNDCANRIVDAVNALHGQVVMVPICDNGPNAGQPIGNCDTAGGSNAQYHIVKVASFWVDYMSDSNNPNQPNAQCQSLPGGPQVLPGTDINGNGSSSCIAGYFVRYVSAGTVGSDPPDANNDAIGIQLIK
jgi:putative Flp pilus-assembly TadE/G-like protein